MLSASMLLLTALAGADLVGPPAPEPAAPPAELLTLVVVPLGDADAGLVRFVVESIERRLTLRVRSVEAVPMPPAAWYPPRQRWRAEKILDHLDALDVGNAWRVAAITEAPISTTKGSRFDWGIAGLGSIGGRSSVFTAYLFRAFRKKDPARYRRYMENLVLHEVGHTLGLDHCPLDRCIMADAKGNAIRSAQASINEFCPRCTRLLKDHLRNPEEQGSWSTAERAVLFQLGFPR